MNRWLNRGVTLVLTGLIGWGAWSVLHWLFLTADWGVVLSNLPLYAVGSYPPDQRWRPLLAILAIVALVGFTLLGPRRGPLQRWLPLLWIGMAPLGLWLVAGGLGLPSVGTRDWGGFSLTLLLTIGSGALALPLGVLLALGRRSALPVLRWSSTAFADDRLEIRALAELEQLHGAIHDAVVGQGDGRHSQFLRPLHHCRKLRSPIQEAVIAVVVEGNKSHSFRLGPNARSSAHEEHNTLDLVLRAPGPPMDAPQTRWRPSRTDGQPAASGPPPTRCRSAAHRWAVQPG